MMRKPRRIMFTPYSHLYDYSTIHIICRFHPKDFYTTVLIPIEVVETYTIYTRINDTSDLLFEQAELYVCQFTLKDRVLHSLAIVKTCFGDSAKTSLT